MDSQIIILIIIFILGYLLGSISSICVSNAIKITGGANNIEEKKDTINKINKDKDISKKNKKLAVKTNQINEKGRKIFQPNLINWSKRYLGTMALTSENKMKSPNILNVIQKIPGSMLSG